MNSGAPALEMRNKYGPGDTYITLDKSINTSSPSLKFFFNILSGPLMWLWRMAINNKCDDIAWVKGSAWVGDIFENIGGRIEVEGLSNIDKVAGPVVFVANHMSTLETFILPAMIRNRKPITFVVKNSLVTMPIFGPIMRSRNPIVVGRSNPREDLTIVLKQGIDRLSKGISVIVFPQSTRSLHFDSSHFNSIGIKLATRANVPVIPLALKTDAWGQGARIKELGKIRPDLPARFKFAEPVVISGNGKKEHADICNFIGETVMQWQAKDGINQ